MVEVVDIDDFAPGERQKSLDLTTPYVKKIEWKPGIATSRPPEVGKLGSVSSGADIKSVSLVDMQLLDAIGKRLVELVNEGKPPLAACMAAKKDAAFASMSEEKKNELFPMAMDGIKLLIAMGK
jgi:hypothetical protein